MKYTFQDSTELPIQRDFIEDLQYFIDIAGEVIPLENSAIETKEQEEATILMVEKKLKEINDFENNVISSIEKFGHDKDIKEILEIKKAVTDTCTSISKREKEKLETEIKQLRSIVERNSGQFESKMLIKLNKLFENGIYRTHNNYTATMDAGKLKGILKASLAEMEYTSNITFENDFLTVRDIVSSLSMPTWTKKGLLHREDKVKMVNVLDFMITSIYYDGDTHLETSFEDKKAERSFKLVFDWESHKIYHADQEITSDSTLSKSLDYSDLAALIKGLKDYIQNRTRTQTLTQVTIEGHNAIKENEVFDCLKIIAEQYGDIARECLERGYVKDEITIKIEEEDGTRTEKYLSREEASKQLSEIGSEGLELAGILGIEK